MSKLSKQAIQQDFSDFSKNWKVDYVELYSIVIVLSLFFIIFAKFSVIMVVLPIIMVTSYLFISTQYKRISNKEKRNTNFLISTKSSSVHKNDNYIFGILIIGVIICLFVVIEGAFITIPIILLLLVSLLLHKELRVAQTIFEVDHFSLIVKQRWRKSEKIDFTSQKFIDFNQNKIVIYDKKKSMTKVYLSLDEIIARDFIEFLELNYGSEQIHMVKNSVTKNWNL